MSEAEDERREERAPETEHDDVSPRRRPRPTARRFAKTIAMGLLIVSLPAIAAIWTLIRPKYTARAEIHVKPIIPWLLFKRFGPERIARYESRRKAQISLMRSPAVLNRVLARNDVRRTEWFRNPYGPILGRLKTPPGPLERLRNHLSVSPRRGTELVDVKMTALKASDAPVIANAVVEEYISYRYECEKVTEEASPRHRQRLQKYKALDEEVKGRKKVLAKLRAELGTTNQKELVSEMLRKEIDALAPKEEAYAALGDLLSNVQMERDLPGIKLLARATVPSEPDDSDWRIALTVAALVLGLGVGVAWAYRR